MHTTTIVLVAFVLTGALRAQSVTTPAPKKLAFLFTTLYEDSIQQAPAALQPFLRQQISVNQASTNLALASQLSNLPIPSPASAYSFVFDPSLGLHVPKVQSLGPVLTERAETIGKNKYHFAFTY